MPDTPRQEPAIVVPKGLVNSYCVSVGGMVSPALIRAVRASMVVAPDYPALLLKEQPVPPKEHK